MYNPMTLGELAFGKEHNSEMRSDARSACVHGQTYGLHKVIRIEIYHGPVSKCAKCLCWIEAHHCCSSLYGKVI